MPQLHYENFICSSIEAWLLHLVKRSILHSWLIHICLSKSCTGHLQPWWCLESKWSLQSTLPVHPRPRGTFCYALIWRRYRPGTHPASSCGTLWIRPPKVNPHLSSQQSHVACNIQQCCQCWVRYIRVAAGNLLDIPLIHQCIVAVPGRISDTIYLPRLGLQSGFHQWRNGA